MRPTPRLLAALALAGLMGAAQLATMLHLVLVPHITCAVHGELVHASDVAPAAPVADDIAFTASPVQGDDHEHCLTLGTQRSAVLRPVLRVAVHAPAQLSSSLCSELPASSSLAVLELAPKASPPV